MKKPSLPISLWIILHAGLVLVLGLSILAGFSPPSVDTDLLGMLPPSSGNHNLAEADRLLTQRHNRDFVILLGDEDFSRARERAEILYRRLDQHLAEANPGQALFEELSFFIDENSMAGFSDYLFEYRYFLLDPQSTALLERGEAKTAADEALAWAYGAFSFAGMDHLDADPFLLTERILRYFLRSSLLTRGLTPRDGVLSGEFEGKNYVLLRGRLSEAGASISTGNGVREIYRITRELADEAQHEIKFIFSGVPFHSYESSTSAQREITLIGAITMLFLLVLFLRVFRSPLPALAIVLTAAVSIFTGLCAVLLVFRSIHILTFNLGASLIGLSVDYSIHFFIRRKNGMEGSAVRRSLFRGVSLSFVSSFICFLIFLFAPFGILRQFALFSAAGLLSSYVTVLCLYPCILPAIYIKTANQDLGSNPNQKRDLSQNARKALLAGLGIIFLVLILVSQVTPEGKNRLRIKNDIRNLYSVSPDLFESEQIASSILGYNSGEWFLVSGDTLQELLEHEEILLDQLNEKGNFFGISSFIPPIKTQKLRYHSAAALLPLAEAQYEALGFPPEYAQMFWDDYAARADDYVLPSFAPPFMEAILSNLLIGQSTGMEKPGGQWYSAIMPLGTVTDPEVKNNLIFIADQYEWAAALNKAEMVSAELDRLTAAMIRLFGIAYGIIVLGILCYYRNISRTLKVAAIPIFAALANLAVYAQSGLSLSFFSVSGFIMVLGLGLDYMFYLGENSAVPQRDDVNLAVILSYVTTAISFGALIFSSFMPVHLLALSVFPGLSAAFAWAMLVKN